MSSAIGSGSNAEQTAENVAAIEQRLKNVDALVRFCGVSR
jgi:hypothetical protein